MLHILGRGELFEILNNTGIPVSHVARQLLDNRGRAFAPAVCNGIGDLGALTETCVWKHLQASSANQISDIRHDPFRASFYELIVIQLLQVLFENRYLLGDNRQQSLERSAGGPRFEVSKPLCILSGEGK